LNVEQNRQNQIDLNLQLLRSQYGLGPNTADIDKQIAGLPAQPTRAPMLTEAEWQAQRSPLGGIAGANNTYQRYVQQYQQAGPSAAETQAAADTRNDLWMQHGIGEQATENQGKINSWLDSIQTDQEKLDTQSLDRDYGAVQAQARNQLADQGLTGGSVDVANRRRQLTEYVRGRQQAVLSGRQARSDANQNLVQQRQRAEAQIGSGTTLNPDFNAEGAQIQAGLNTSESLLAPTAIGQAFTLGGSMAGSYIGQHPSSPGGSDYTQNPGGGGARANPTGTITRN
jgi:hypothetical protein